MNPLVFASHTSSRNSTKKPIWRCGTSIGNLNFAITEYSDLTYPARPENTGWLWSIEDGATNYMVAIPLNNPSGAGKWTLTSLPTTIDVEACTSAMTKSQNYIYLCDCGNNADTINSRGTNIAMNIYRIKEPIITGSVGTIPASDYIKIPCQFNVILGHRDVEGVFADPDSDDLYFFTKRTIPCLCFRLSPTGLETGYTGIQDLVYMGPVYSGGEFNKGSTCDNGGNSGICTAACISPNGTEIILKNYWDMFYWRRNKNVSIYNTLSGAYTSKLANVYVGGGGATGTAVTATVKENNGAFFHPLGEPQGEAVTFDRNGLHLYTCSEALTIMGTTPLAYPIFKYSRLPDSFTQLEDISFQNTGSYTGCIDTYISTTSPESNTPQNTQSTMILDLDTPPGAVTRNRQALIKFNVSAIPSNAKVLSANLQVCIQAEGRSFLMYRMITGWISGVTFSGLPNTGARTVASGYRTNGLEAATYPDITGWGFTGASSGIDGYTGRIRINLPIDTIQNWVSDPSTNNGWLITDVFGNAGDGMQWHSSEATTPKLRPQLNVSYYR